MKLTVENAISILESTIELIRREDVELRVFDIKDEHEYGSWWWGETGAAKGFTTHEHIGTKRVVILELYQQHVQRETENRKET